MKALDKVYVSIGYEAQTHPFHTSVEYISKDALLEKLSRAKNLRLKSGENESSDGNRVIDALIKMINEM